jgi:selenophosphate synthetase-related protein
MLSYDPRVLLLIKRDDAYRKILEVYFAIDASGLIGCDDIVVLYGDPRIIINLLRINLLPVVSHSNCSK